MDALWLDGGRVVRAFEVECTTSMTSGLQRGSNLPANVPKTMVIPEEREGDFERKMKSPLFSEHFARDNWGLLYFNALIQAYGKTKAKTSLENLLGQKKKPDRPAAGVEEVQAQQNLFSFGSESEQAPQAPAAVAEDPPPDEQ
jgi:hypothetical protein